MSVNSKIFVKKLMEKAMTRPHGFGFYNPTLNGGKGGVDHIYYVNGQWEIFSRGAGWRDQAPTILSTEEIEIYLLENITHIRDTISRLGDLERLFY